MEWLKSFMTGYERVNNINKEDTLTYKDVKKDLNKILQFKEIEEKTREKVTEIKEYFEKFVGLEDEETISDKKTVVTIARKYGEKMEEYSEEFYDNIAITRIDPGRVQARISMLEERIEKFRVHGRYMVLIGVVLVACVGGLTAWQVYGITAVSYIAIGVAAGFTVGVVAFSLIYFGYLAQLKDHLSKWTNLLLNEISKVPDIKREIEKKKETTRHLSKLLLREVTEDEIIFPSEIIVTKCNKYLDG